MGKTFENLRVIRREYESGTGCSEVCQTPDGELCIRLRIRDRRCQREYLSGKAKAKARLDREVLEVLLPYRDGTLFDTWLRQKPDLRQRRDACLSLVAQCVEANAAPCVIALSARLENLRFDGQTAWLQFLPDWGDWRPDGSSVPDAAAVAALCCRLLTCGYSRLQALRYPSELQLVRTRQECGDYQTWSELQRDLAAIPDGLLPLARPYQTFLRRLIVWAKRYAKPAACIVAALLLAAALLSLFSAYTAWRGGQNSRSWPGMTLIGDQQLRDG